MSRYIIRHPSVKNKLLLAATIDRSRSLIESSPEPFCVAIIDLQPNSEFTSDNDLSSALGLPHQTQTSSTRLPLLNNFLDTPLGILACDIRVYDNLIQVRPIQVGRSPFDWDFERGSVTVSQYLNRIFESIESKEAFTIDFLTNEFSRRLVTDSCRFIHQITATISSPTSGCTVYTTRDTIDHRLRGVRTYVTACENELRLSLVDTTKLQTTLARAVRDIDAAITIIIAQSLADIAKQNTEASEARRADEIKHRKAERRVEEKLKKAGRRVTVATSSVVLPGIWLTYWAIPSAFIEIFGHGTSGTAGQLIIIGLAVTLGVIGFVVSLLLTSVKTKREEVVCR